MTERVQVGAVLFDAVDAVEAGEGLESGGEAELVGDAPQRPVGVGVGVRPQPPR